MKIITGAHRTDDADSARTYSIKRAWIHSEYDSFELANDFCILEVAEPIIMGEHVSIACLPNQDAQIQDTQE